MTQASRLPDLGPQRGEMWTPGSIVKVTARGFGPRGRQLRPVSEELESKQYDLLLEFVLIYESTEARSQFYLCS